MKILNNVTLQSLKKNRVRTIVTIIGVILSAAMITAVTTFISSFQDYLLQNVIAEQGSWQVEFRDVTPEFVEELSSDKQVKEYAVNKNIGYSIIESGKNNDKPYLFFTALSDKSFELLSVKMISGRLPQNENEIIIPEHLFYAEEGRYDIGKSISIELGVRKFDGEPLGQDRPAVFDEDGENIMEDFELTGTTKLYTVVGVFAKPGFEGFFAPGYTCITKLGEHDGSAVNMLVNIKNPANIYDFAENASQGCEYSFNSDLLRFMGVSNDDMFNNLLYSMGAILIGLIMVGSVLLIYNSFSISVSERTRQFGILSSVGATKKQIRRSVLFEGCVIGLIGVPVGILVGIAGAGITLFLLRDVFISMFVSEVSLKLAVSFPAIAVAAVVGFLTIMISAYIPAKRASKLSAIDAIRQTSDVKISAKQIKTSKLTLKLFGLEGLLAQKNFKRNKKQYRSTIISLFVSIVLFISASAFGMYLGQGVDKTIEEYGYDIAFFSRSISVEETIELYEEFKNVSSIVRSGYYENMVYYSELPMELYSSDYLEHIEVGDGSESVNEAVYFYFVDDASYEEYIKSLGLDINEYRNGSKLVSTAKLRGYDRETGRYISTDIFAQEKPMTLKGVSGAGGDGNEKTIDINIGAFTDSMPENISNSLNSGIYVFAPYSAKEQFAANGGQSEGSMALTFSSDDPAKSAKEMSEILKELNVFSGYSLFNIAEIEQSNRSLILVIDVFSYGFIVLISLITIANVFNTISTNINLRRREFAMLRSVGMTDKGFNRMMRYECLLYGVKALLYGLPVSLLLTYLIYNSVVEAADVAFTVPWLSVFISIVSVFMVVFITMIYSVSKIKKGNTVADLKSNIF